VTTSINARYLVSITAAQIIAGCEYSYNENIQRRELRLVNFVLFFSFTFDIWVIMEEDFVAASLITQFLAFPQAERDKDFNFCTFPKSCYSVLPSILSLTSSGHELEGVHNFFRDCVSLRKLDLDGCKLSSVTDELLHLSKLVNLHLKRCSISTFHENFACIV